MQDDNLRLYFASYTNMLKVVKYRNYHVSNKHKLSSEQFNKLYEEMTIRDMKEEISGIVFHKKTLKEGVETKESIILFWHLEPNLGKDIINIHNKMTAENVKKAIVVVDNNITATCKTIIGMLKKNKTDPVIIDCWTLKESMIFVPEHRLVPQHRICSLKEKKEIFKAYGIIYEKKPLNSKDNLQLSKGLKKGKIPPKTPLSTLQNSTEGTRKGVPVKKQLPNIKSDDVMVKYLGATRGQLMEIIRKRDTDPNSTVISYRFVV